MREVKETLDECWAVFFYPQNENFNKPYVPHSKRCSIKLRYKEFVYCLSLTVQRTCGICL